jgi:uncharacterized protein (DUF486 family)
MPHAFWQATGLLVLYMKQGLKLDYLWAALCIVGAVYFVFRGT